MSEPPPRRPVIRPRARRTAAPPAAAEIGHNGGPPLDEEPHVPAWGTGPIRTYVAWRAARKKAFAPVSRDVALFRIKKAERLGLTYEEYTSELLDTGRHLQAEDTQRIAEIIAQRKPGSAS